jgi:hypothetical protein
MLSLMLISNMTIQICKIKYKNHRVIRFLPSIPWKLKLYQLMLSMSADFKYDNKNLQS